MNLMQFVLVPFGTLKLLSARVWGNLHLATAIAAVCALGIATKPAQAEYVTATFSNVNPGEVVTIPVGSSQESGWAGEYNFTKASGKLSGNITSFCIDISQDISSGNTVTFSVANLQDAPVPGNSMGTLRANLVRELWYNDFALIGSSNSNAAAFQIAIWEIINETKTNSDGTLKLNINSGTFFATDQDSTTLTTANSWLSALNLSGTGSMANNLYALTSSQYQDYVVQIAPAPSGLIIGIIGAIVLVLPSAFRLRRHFSRASANLA